VELKDFFFVPVYFVLILFIAKRVKPLVTNSHTGKYFIPALSVKLLGALALGFIYQFYYHGGDTLNYFHDAQRLTAGFFTDKEATFRVFFYLDNNMDADYMAVRNGLWYYKDPASFFVVRTIFILGLLCFQSYGGVALLFGALSFSGVWVLYYSFCFLRPHLYKWFAYVILFMPSMVFWGSGIMKDTLCLAALGWFFYACYKIIYKGIFSLSVAIILIVSVFFLVHLKIYILLCFFPSALYWFFLEKTNFSNKNTKIFLRPFLLLVGLGVTVLALGKFAASTERYNMETIAQTTEVTSSYLLQVSNRENGSGYSLNTAFDGSFSSLIKVIPEAVVVTYFRPFLWEAKNPVMLLSALEGLGALFLVLATIYMVIKNDIKLLFRPPSFVLISLIFVVLFGTAIGMSTYNFGTLVRYKIPALPFLFGALITLFFDAKSSLKKA
jgi:hypothetical protein